MKSLAVYFFVCISAVLGCVPASAENIHMIEMERTHAMLDACGPAHRHINNRAFTTNQYLASPEAGKALVYFFFDPNSLGGGILGPHIHIGVDGKWVGALAPPFFAALNLAPGTHHVCARWSAPMVGPYVELDTLHAQAGKTYAYTTSLLTDMHSSNILLMQPTDPDQLQSYLHIISSLAAAQAALRPNYVLSGKARMALSNPMQTPAALRACGPSGIKEHVGLDTTRPLPAAPSKNALVYFVFDTHIWGGLFHPRGPVVQIGVDGKWVGALQGKSYFPLRLAPGKHHVCFEESAWRFGHYVNLVQLQAQPGKTYFLSAYMLDAENPNGDGGGMYMTARPLNRDEGALLVQSSALSTALTALMQTISAPPPK
jgi:hypothetical protein